MPLSGSSGYVPTVDEFLAHRALVDADLGAGNAMTLTTARHASIRSEAQSAARKACSAGFFL